MKTTPVLQALEHFGLKAEVIEGQAHMCCPFHEEDTASFDIKLDNGAFNCFGCGAHGGFIDFVARLDGNDPMAAMVLIRKLRAKPAPDLDEIADVVERARLDRGVEYDIEHKWGTFHNVNWQKLTIKHPVAEYLIGTRQFERDTLEAFDVRLSERANYPIVIPWRRSQELIGYVYRTLGVAYDAVGKPLKKYRFNSGFSAETALAYYKTGGDTLLICEGIMDMMKAAQFGWPHGACLPSWRFNESHAMYLRAHGVKSVICALDNTPTGDEGYKLMKAMMPMVRRFEFPGKFRKDIGECGVNEFWRGVM